MLSFRRRARGSRAATDRVGVGPTGPAPVRRSGRTVSVLVRSARDTGETVSGDPVVEADLLVIPADGSTSYGLTHTVLVAAERVDDLYRTVLHGWDDPNRPGVMFVVPPGAQAAVWSTPPEEAGQVP
jgi:hypothetical protein